jgi:hypothetical protein
MRKLFAGYSKAQKKEFCEEWKASGLTQSQYCRDKGINAVTFSGWIKKFLRNENTAKTKVKGKSKFIPLSLQSSAQIQGSLEIIAANKLTIRLPITVEESLILKIIKDLSKCI